MRSTEIEVDTSHRRIADLTGAASEFCAGEGDGLLHVFAPHATAGLALVELGSGTEEDLDALLDRLLPREDRYVHEHGSAGHGGDHVLPALLSPALVLPVLRGDLVLGTWQSLVLVDRNADNPQRRVLLSFLPG